MLQLPVLILQLLQSLGFAAVHPAVLRLPAVIGLLCNAVLPTQLRRGQSSFSLLQNRDDLLFAMPCPFHLRFSFRVWRNSHSTWLTFRVLDHYRELQNEVDGK